MRTVVSSVFSRQALITSATGLGIAIMAALAHHFLTGRVRSLVNDLEWISHSIYEFLTTEAGDLSADVEEVEDRGAGA